MIIFLKFKILIFCTLLTINLYAQVNKEQIKDWQSFLEKKSHSIFVKNDQDFSDLEVLKKVLSDKRIVMLGEFNHGSREVNLTKNRLIEYLHKHLGYKVLLLESGLAEVNTMNTNRKDLAHENMIYRLTGPWQSEEFVSLMGYVKENQDLKVGGFDPQKSGNSFTPFFNIQFSKISPELINLLTETEIKNQNFVKEIQKIDINTTILLKRDSIIQTYQEIQALMNGYKAQFIGAGNTEIELKTINKSIENRIAYLRYFTTYKTQFRQRWAARDSVMAANVMWYASEIYPNEKIIISAHNYHISKSNEKELVMGEILKEKFQNEIYVLGFFAGQGTFANNARKTETLILPTSNEDIKAITLLGKQEAFLVNFPKKMKKGTSWIFKEIIVSDTFIDLDNSNRIVLKQWFDGVILIKNILPALYKN
jgi:erythromycin esterase